MKRCPSVELLRTLLTDDPSGTDSDLLASHVQHCTRCQQQLEELTAGANRPADRADVVSGAEPTFDYELNASFLAQLRQAYSLVKVLPPEPDDGRDTPCQDSRRDRADRQDPLPRVVGYEILEEIGRGGAGVVYKARQIGLDRLVALKMLLDGSHAAPDQLARFRREAEAIARLRHANIVQIYEVGTQDGRPFFSMEYVAAGSLAQYLASTPQDSRSAAQLVRTLAEAIHAAHQQGIVHRDLKPANILLTTECKVSSTPSRDPVLGTCVPKITDFGLAKIVQRPAQSGQGDNEGEPLTVAVQARTRTGAILGTPNYMAPEQAQANPIAIGPAADVYALGAILYELLTGRPPFNAATALDTVLQVLHADPVPPRRFQPTVPRDLETICLTCLHKEPHRRYADGQALSEDLRRFLSGEPIRARPVAWWERARKWARRRPASAALIGISALAVLGLLLGGLWHNNRLAEAFTREQKERDRADRVVQDALDTMSRLVRVGSRDPVGSQPQAFRRRLGEEVGAFYQKLLADTAMQAAPVQQRVGAIHYDLGLITRERGQPDQAIKHLRHAADLQEQIVAASPENAEYCAALALTYVNLGSLLAESGQRAQAEELLGKARDYCQQLTQQQPDVPRYQGMLAQSYHMLGCLYLKRDEDLAQSREALEKAAVVEERLVQEQPDVVAHKVALAGHHVNLILVYSGLGKLDQATASADKAVSILEAVTRDHPQEQSYAHRLGSCYMNCGYLAMTTGRPEQALKSWRRAVDVLEALYRKYDWGNIRQELASDWSDVRRDLASAHGGQADALVQLHRPLESLPHWKRLLELSEGPDCDSYRLRYGLALMQAGDYAGAEAETQALTTNASGEMLFNLACLYSLGCSTVRADQTIPQADRESRAEKYAAQALTALRKAATAGLFKSSAYKEHLDKDLELTPIRARAEFQSLLRSLGERVP